MWHAKEPPCSKCAALYRHWSVADSGISEPGGRVGFLWSGDCVDTFSHRPYLFLMRVKNKLDIVNILVDYIKSICVLCSQNLQQKRNSKKNSDKKGASGPRSAFNHIVFVSVKTILQRAEKQHKNKQNHIHVDIRKYNVACWQNIVCM